jgi:cytochrome c553
MIFMSRVRVVLSLASAAGLGFLIWAFLGLRTQQAIDGSLTPTNAVEDYGRWLPGPTPRAPAFATEVAPILEKYCITCHGSEKPRGGVRLPSLAEKVPAQNAGDLWDRVENAFQSGRMPPPGKPRPTTAEGDTLDAWFNAVAVALPGQDRPSDRVTVRRLNRTEYNNTVRDLIGLDLRPADDFPADDIGDGFDNNAEVLSLPPILLEKYLAAAERVVDTAFRSDAIRQRLLNPPTDDVVPVSSRRITLPERDHVRDRLVLSAADLPAPDPAEEERQRAYLVLRAFADRAYRRPALHEEVTRLLRFVEDAQQQGEGYEHGIRVALEAVLCSPQFLFRIESRSGSRRLSDFELATRLSYFLWSSTPDEELFACAAKGTLRQGNTLTAQVRRMLRDPKARALAENFAAQWLQTRGLRELTPDPARFPDFDEPLRVAMARETELFFDAVVREDRSVLDFLDADYTFVNDRLARHYGLPGISGSEFRKVSLAGTPRGGVLTHASVLAVTSNPTRTSPVKRGKWVMENILGTPPTAPPPGVADLKESVMAGGVSLRRQLERHRADPKCAACHASMDPLGFGLESFDALGAWRDNHGDQPLDDTGILPDGRTFDGPAGLRTILLEQRQAFARCLTEKMFTYALGRGVTRSDRRTVKEIACKLADNDYRFSALVLALVHSHPFQTPVGSGDSP